jgi:NADH-quinone oxidoreductase subunit G
MIDVCPVGALTDRTFRFKSRVWYINPVDAHRDCKKCAGKARVWLKGNEVYRVTGRKDIYGEVAEWICNECRYDKKQTRDWVIEGPSDINRQSVISQNHYTLQEPEHKPLLNAVQVVPGGKGLPSHENNSLK